MKSLEEVIHFYFPAEKINKIYSVKLKANKIKIYNILFSYFKDPKLGLYKGIKLAKTDNYWFLDLRYDITLINLLIKWLFIAIFLIIFGRLLLQIELWFLILIAPIFLIDFLISTIFYDKGLFINVFKHNCVIVEEGNDKLKLNIVIPKYSKDAIWKMKYGNKILDFLGVTVSSAEGKFEYIFELE